MTSSTNEGARSQALARPRDGEVYAHGTLSADREGAGISRRPLTNRARSATRRTHRTPARLPPSSTDLDRLQVVSAPSASAVGPRRRHEPRSTPGHSSSGVGGPSGARSQYPEYSPSSKARYTTPLPLYRSGAGSYWIPILDNVTQRALTGFRLCVDRAWSADREGCALRGVVCMGHGQSVYAFGTLSADREGRVRPSPAFRPRWPHES